jgi:SAM-dependent methyltransferase
MSCASQRGETRRYARAVADPSPPPLPPREVAAYVNGGIADEDWARGFDGMGRHLKDDLLRVLPGGLPMGGRVLDFGCGSGRLLRHFLAEAEATEIHGCDIDAPSIAWVQRHLCPPCHAVRCGARPPLPYPDHFFDLVLAVAVFSQLADGWEAWILELRRVLRPGGIFVASLMGPWNAQVIAGRPVDDAEIGMSVHGFGRPWSAGGPMILHSEWWLRAHYGRAFDVLAFVPRGIGSMDGLIMRRPDRPAPSEADLEAPEPGEERELRAARSDVRRLHREYATLNAAHDAYAEAYARQARELQTRGLARRCRNALRRMARR